MHHYVPLDPSADAPASPAPRAPVAGNLLARVRVVAGSLVLGGALVTLMILAFSSHAPSPSSNPSDQQQEKFLPFAAPALQTRANSGPPTPAYPPTYPPTHVASSTFSEYRLARIAMSGAQKPDAPAAAALPGLDECDVDAVEQCSVPQLEAMYVDALWDYYDSGKAPTLTDEQFDTLKMELNWQGSGFPTLRRDEVAFVKAVLANARGEPILSDEEYDVLKEKVKANRKRKDVTSFLLYTKGAASLSDSQFETMKEAMCADGIDVSPTGVQCMLSDTPTTLQNKVGDIVQMYGALHIVPSSLSLAAWAVVAALVSGPDSLIDFAPYGLVASQLTALPLTAQLIRYVELSSPQLLEGTCPCCESPVRTFFGHASPDQITTKCGNCSTAVSLDRETMTLSGAGGFPMVGDHEAPPVLSRLVNSATLMAVGATVGVNDETRLGPPPKADAGAGKKVEPMLPYLASQVRTGIFAWAVLLGYAVFGEKFVSRVRGKGIGIHSGVINDFCTYFAIPPQLKQKYIQTAKRNGHDFGFLVEGRGMFGDGLFGEPALEWWKERGW